MRILWNYKYDIRYKDKMQTIWVARNKSILLRLQIKTRVQKKLKNKSLQALAERVFLSASALLLHFTLNFQRFLENIPNMTKACHRIDTNSLHYSVRSDGLRQPKEGSPSIECHILNRT